MRPWQCFAATSWPLQPWPRGQVLEAEPGLPLCLAAQCPSLHPAAWAAPQEGPGFGVAGLEERGDREEGVGQEVCPAVTCHSWRTAGVEGGCQGTAGRDPGERRGAWWSQRWVSEGPRGKSPGLDLFDFCLSLTVFFKRPKSNCHN